MFAAASALLLLLLNSLVLPVIATATWTYLWVSTPTITFCALDSMLTLLVTGGFSGCGPLAGRPTDSKEILHNSVYRRETVARGRPT